jgi:hypothetical protein
MTRVRGNEKGAADEELEAQDSPEGPEGSGILPPLPELARRAISFGLSGLFLTEETIRKAVGDTLPRDWLDFAVDQSERTRKEFLERLTYEIAQSLENVDVVSVLSELLEGRTLQVKAEVRLAPAGPEDPAQKLRVAIEKGEGEA